METSVVICNISKKYRLRDNFVDIVIVSIFDMALADFNIIEKVIFCNNYRNIKEYFDKSTALVCDCAITLEMKVGSVLSSHFKNLSTSFLGLLLVLCNSFSV